MNGTIFVIVIGAILAANVQAQDGGHARWHQYYKHWKQPGITPPLSCCDARIISPDGKDLRGDCEPTKAEFRNGDWYFWHRQINDWIKIPDSKIIRERNPSSEEGHVCSISRGWGWEILCAVPPDAGG